MLPLEFLSIAGFALIACSKNSLIYQLNVPTPSSQVGSIDEICQAYYPLLTTLCLVDMKESDIDQLKYSIVQMECFLNTSCEKLREQWMADSCPV